MDEKRCIAVFDSGVGGLTVLQHLVDELPEYDFIYFGDTARAPYGGRTRETIAEYTEQAVQFLFSQGAGLIVLACNSACTAGLRSLQEKYIRTPGVTDKNILGIVIPTAEAAVDVAKGGKVVVLGTEATVNSGIYTEEIHKLNSGVEIEAIACPLLAPLVEAGWEEKDVARRAVEEYVGGLEKDIAVLVLGCTHYPYLMEHFEELLPGVPIMEQGPVVARKLRDYLKRHPEIDAVLGKSSRRKFFSSDSPTQFKKLGSRYFKHPIVSCEKVDEVGEGTGECKLVFQTKNTE